MMDGWKMPVIIETSRADKTEIMYAIAIKLMMSKMAQNTREAEHVGKLGKTFEAIRQALTAQIELDDN